MYKSFVKSFFLLLFFLNNSATLGMITASLQSNSKLYKQYSKKCYINGLVLLNLPSDILCPLIGSLSNKDKNTFQKISKKAREIGSKRIPNFYKLAKYPEFIAHEKDYIYGFINAIYDQNETIIYKMKNKIQNNLSKDNSSEILKVEIPIYTHLSRSYEDIKMFFTIHEQSVNNTIKNCITCSKKSYDSKKKYGDFSETIVLGDRGKPNAFLMACYAGNLKEVKQLLNDNGFPKDCDVLNNAFSIALHKNDFDCLELFVKERNKENLAENNFKYAQLNLLALALDLNNETAFTIISSSNWQKVDYYQFPAVMLLNVDVINVLEGGGLCADRDVYDYRKYIIKPLLNIYNKERKKRGWKTSVEIFIEQDQNLDIVIKKPLIEALQKNDISYLRQLVGEIENKQLFYNEQCMNDLRYIHNDVLLQSIELKNKEGFDVLSRLRLENETECFGKYHALLLKIIKHGATVFSSI